jgi:hypothetical protein
MINSERIAAEVFNALSDGFVRLWLAVHKAEICLRRDADTNASAEVLRTALTAAAERYGQRIFVWRTAPTYRAILFPEHKDETKPTQLIGENHEPAGTP